MKKFLFALFLTVYAFFSVYATHQRAGEITYRWLYGLTYEVTIITYTYTPSPADRPELELFWGDGTSDIIQRVEQVHLPNNISYNRYTYDGPGTGGQHTFPAPGTYTLSMEDPNRNAGVINIPNSVNIPMYLETKLVINPFLGNNNSPVLLNAPIDNACIYQPFLHNPWAYDPDGDSLSYSLTACKGQGGLDIPGFFYPPANNTFSINPLTGELLWDSPQLNGEYNICIIIDEWRNGIWIGSVRRDMQITVVSCINQPPIIQQIADTCILAGTLFSLNIQATDPNGDIITLTGNGAPLLITPGPATFPQPVQGTGSVSSTFTWQTQCEHVKKAPYQMNFKVIDDGYPVQLVDFMSFFITIVAPAPENLSATPDGNKINLKWDKSLCANAKGYRIFRRSGYYGFFPDHCETGVPAYTGYVMIAQLDDINDTTFLDDNNGQGLIRGHDYCYMVIAYFSDDAESYASNEACAELTRDVPVITNVSVKNTDITDGSVMIVWTKPTDFDSVQIPGPYKYLIYRRTGLSGTNVTLIDSLSLLQDTVYTDTLINTLNFPYHYRIDFYNDEPGNRFYVGSTEYASSVFLSLTPSDNTLTLSWQFAVPWIHDSMTIYRQNPSTMLFDSIGVTTSLSFADTGLVNGIEYCYYVKSSGHYSASGFASPLINLSQRAYGKPTDNEPPCPPLLSGTVDCKDIKNTLWWSNQNNACDDDIVSYNLYYSPGDGADYFVIFSSNNIADTFYIHPGLNTITGCYYVTAIDSFNNESIPSNLVCFDIDQCLPYELPNVFSPNGDGYNDVFRPFPYDFVDHINIVIFNRWGTIVFKTEDPDINWDGKDRNSKNACSVGVYYYICDVFEKRLQGLTKRTLQGNIHLIR